MSDNKRGKKRPKSYYRKCAQGGKKFKSANDLAAGMKGFIVTCNKYEKETVREMYNVLNEYADQMYGPEVKLNDPEADNNDSGSEEDMEKAMAKETSAIKEKAKTERRFQNTDTKTKNCIFIRTTIDNPSDLAHKIFTDTVATQTQKARYAIRLLPVSITCKVNIENIKETAKTMLKPYFETEFGVGHKFTTMCKIRNNQSVSRTTILPVLGGIVHELNPLHQLCHDEPDLVIIVEIIRNICCMSVVKDYFTFRKYNFHEVLKINDNNDIEKANTDSISVTVEETKPAREADSNTEKDPSHCNIFVTLSEIKQDIASDEKTEIPSKKPDNLLKESAKQSKDDAKKKQTEVVVSVEDTEKIDKTDVDQQKNASVSKEISIEIVPIDKSNTVNDTKSPNKGKRKDSQSKCDIIVTVPENKQDITNDDQTSTEKQDNRIGKETARQSKVDDEKKKQTEIVVCVEGNEKLDNVDVDQQKNASSSGEMTIETDCSKLDSKTVTVNDNAIATGVIDIQVELRTEKE